MREAGSNARLLPAAPFPTTTAPFPLSPPIPTPRPPRGAVGGGVVCPPSPGPGVRGAAWLPARPRHPVIADLLAAVAIGTAAGSLGSGLFAHYFSWRVIFGLTAVIAVVLAVALGRLPESSAPPAPGGPVAQLRQVFRRPWARFLILFAIPEGAMVRGFFVYFAPALESRR